MNLHTKIEVLLDEYASGERPQNEVADDLKLLIDTAFNNGEQAGYCKGHDNGYDVGWEDGYEEGNINGYSDAMNEVKDKKEKLLKLIGELYAQ